MRKQREQVAVKVKTLHPDAAIPRYAKALDAGFDLVAVEDVIIAPGETAKIKTGLAFAIPDGYELQVRPRSGISAKTKLRISNSPGTIDAGYRGEVAILMDNIRIPSGAISHECFDLSEQPIQVEQPVDRHAYLIRKGERIAQGVLCEVPLAMFEQVAELDETERGAGGFGSSGVGTQSK
ncbi:dUTP diphosphatase [Brevibacillus fulvus]|uniref:dUTP diphosphatase n=1 Tax=Brevibacillus fulvus TaxID=1125967 RepID=A0A939BTT0_9BACL|nr:dUTP diphosphatase [Brevibacillus fulvus]MBM7588781.1 dUTP pyrophosphatase [Brevibacillus fulvus]